MNPVLEAKDLSVGFKGKNSRILLKNLDLKIFPGEMVLILGRNGSGKTTLLSTLAGLYSPLQGEIFFSGESILKMNAGAIARKVSVVLSRAELPAGLLVEDLISLGRNPYTGGFGKLSSKDREIIQTSLMQSGLENFKGRFVDQLSDGERQKTMVARALAQDTPLMLLDEPTAFLDVINKISLTKMLKNLCVETGKSFLFTSHDIQLALQVADRVWLLDGAGSVINCSPQELIQSNFISLLLDNSMVSLDPDTFAIVWKK